MVTVEDHSLGISHHKHKITSLIWAQLVIKENVQRKKTLVGRICVLSDRNKRLRARSFFYYFSEKLPLSQKQRYFRAWRNNQRYLFPTMLYTMNSSPMLITKSVFKLILVLSNYQSVQWFSKRCFFFTIPKIHVGVNIQTWIDSLTGDCLELVAWKLPRVTS